jgi:Cellulase (glycosyl hydrolase family 5)
LITRRTFLASASAAAVIAQPGDSFVRVSTRDPRYLELSDGSPFIPIGLNLIAPPERAADGTPGLRVYEDWLEKLCANGGNYVRAWLSNSFWDIEHARSGEYDEAKAQRIDALLAMARRRGVRVKLTIEHFRSIGGGTQAWAEKPLHHVSNGGTAESIADFFDGERSRAKFRKKIEWFAVRFGDRPEILGWELWNEVNAVRGGNYLAWTELMLAELHRRFRRNLCMQSLGSFDTAAVRETYRRHSRLPGNDLAQVHRYLDLGASLEICKGPVDVLAADAVREIAAFEPGKPVILAESGAVEPRHAGPFQLYAKDRAGTLLHDVLFAPFFAGAAGPGQIWHWDAYVAKNDLWWHFGRFAEAVKGIDPAAERFTPSMIPHQRLRIYCLNGGRHTLLWCRDARNDWQSELDRDEPPEQLIGLTVEVPDISARPRIAAYDPWSGKSREIASRVGRIELPPFRRSVVLRIET